MLEVGDVSFSYHLYRKVFSCVSFQLDKGEIIHLRGGNGSGKTTLLRGLMGLVDLRFATISLAGYTDLREFRRRCWYMPSEHHGLFTHLTAWDNLVCFRQLQNRDVADKDLCDHLRDFGFGSSFFFFFLFFLKIFFFFFYKKIFFFWFVLFVSSSFGKKFFYWYEKTFSIVQVSLFSKTIMAIR